MNGATAHKRVLVTGIDGFVGSHLAEMLLGEGVEVHGTIPEPEPSQHILPIAGQLRLHRADVLDAPRIEQLVASVRPARIIHLAGQAYIPASVTDPASTFRTNVMGGVTVLDAARSRLKHDDTGPSVLIVSSGEVYGAVDQSLLPMREDLPLRPANPYAASKAAIDLIAQEYHHTFGVDVIVARPFNHAGPRQSSLFVCSDFARQIARMALGKAPATMNVGNLDPERDFADVRDVVRAYWMLFDRKTDERVFNVCSGTSVRIGAIVDMLRDLSGIQVEVVVDKTRVRQGEVTRIVGSADRLKNATGWTPVYPLRQTLADVMAYWKAELSRTL
jgi:GDP-4-dehydro-6-deoxy-D-mannose reductase